MAIDFPSAPANGQEHTSGGVTYVYNGTGWVMKPVASVPAAPLDALAYNGMQINGSMEVSQERVVPIRQPQATSVTDGKTQDGIQGRHYEVGDNNTLPGLIIALMGWSLRPSLRYWK